MLRGGVYGLEAANAQRYHFGVKTVSHHPDLAAFIASLRRLEDTLLDQDEHIWAAKIGRVRTLSEASDGHCITMFFEMSGGMGSFSDLMLNAPADANDAFHAERRRAYQLAQALK